MYLNPRSEKLFHMSLWVGLFLCLVASWWHLIPKSLSLWVTPLILLVGFVWIVFFSISFLYLLIPDLRSFNTFLLNLYWLVMLILIIQYHQGDFKAEPLLKAFPKNDSTSSELILRKDNSFELSYHSQDRIYSKDLQGTYRVMEDRVFFFFKGEQFPFKALLLRNQQLLLIYESEQFGNRETLFEVDYNYLPDSLVNTYP